jgi:hypothetical protein
MPINLKRNFNPRVPIKKSEKCSWRRHCRGCARDLIGYLEVLANNNPDRAVFASLPALTKCCNGRYRKNKKPYSERMVQETLRVFRELKIVSKRIVRPVDYKGLVVDRECFIVAPHKSMTIRHPRVCVVAGLGKGPGTWIDDIWVKDATSGEWLDDNEIAMVIEGPVPETVVGIVPETVPETVPEIVRESVPEIVLQGHPKCADWCADECAEQSIEQPLFEEDTNDAYEVSLQTSPIVDVPSLGSLVSQLTSGTSRTTEPRNPGDHPNDATTVKPLPQTAVSSSLGLLTDEKQQPSSEVSEHVMAETVSARPAVKTVGQLFDGVTDLLDVVTNGELDKSNRDWSRFKNDSELEAALREAVKRTATLLVRDTKALATVMGTTIDVLVEWNPAEPIDKSKLFQKSRPQLYPKSWLTIKGRLAQGLPLKKRRLSGQQLWDQFVATHEYQAASNTERMTLWDDYQAKSDE